MIVYGEKNSGTAGGASAVLELEPVTTTRESPVPIRQPSLRRGSGREPERWTAQEVSEEERGDFRACDPTSVTQGSSPGPTTTGVDIGEGARVRSELARDLVRTADRLLGCCGQVRLATEIQVLKRELSRCHESVGRYPSENEFLSIITLVESSLARCTWKDYTAEQLQAVREAFALGYTESRVTFEAYELVRRAFASKEVDTTPTVDLESLDTEALKDEDEE